MQRQAVTQAEPATAPPIVHKVLHSSGQPLNADTRTFMEPRFGHDFSQVRVHTDAKAAESARAVNALAYTVGRDIVFGAGHYTPETTTGKGLLAHELTHVIQQRGTAGGVQRVTKLDGPNESALEREAAAQAERVLAEPAMAPATIRGESSGAQLLRLIGRGVPTPGATRRRVPTRGATGRESSRREPAPETGTPRELPCIISTEPGHRTGVDLMFGVTIHALSPTHRAEIAAFVERWRARGGGEQIIVDGYASTDGPLAYNTRLSCNRTRSAGRELIRLRVPAAKISLVGHGETSEFSTVALPPNRRTIISTGVRPTRRRRPVPTQPQTPERPSTVCGTVDDFFRAILLIEPSLLSDLASCVCLAAGIGDVLPVDLPGVGGADCLCNVFVTLQEVYRRGSDGGCWSVSNITAGDVAAINALAGLAAVDCASEPIATALGAFIGGLLGAESGPGAAGTAAGGAELGDILGEMILDLAVLAAQNAILQDQGTVAQVQACARLISRRERGRQPSPRRRARRREREPRRRSRARTEPRGTRTDPSREPRTTSVPGPRPGRRRRRRSDSARTQRSTDADFCRPYTSAIDARMTWVAMRAAFIPAITGVFGSQVGALWSEFLTPGRRTRHQFSSTSNSIVQGFANSVTTREDQTELLNVANQSLRDGCPTIPPNSWVDVPLSNFVVASDLRGFDMDFNQVFEIPGNIAGGVGDSNFYGRDYRSVSGNVKFFRATDNANNTTSVKMITDFNYTIRDTIDFCPGDPGAGIERHLTVPLSRLEKSGFAHDVPFQVIYRGRPIERTLDSAVVSRCWPNP